MRPDELRISLEAEHGLLEHPKAALLFSLAWQYGHSSGVEEVQGIYGELAELLK